MAGQHPFLRDSELTLDLRTYYFDRSNTDGSDEETWAFGGSLAWKSGRWRDLVSMGAELFTSQRLYGPDDRDGLEMLRPRQTGLTVLGTAHLDLHYEDVLRARLYRQRLDMPYLNGDDSRMIPNTFEAYQLRGELGSFQFGGGHVTQIKTRGARDFVSMSEAAGASGSRDRGLTLLGALYTPSESLSFGVIDYYGWDTLNTFYTEADYNRKLTDEISLKLSGQFTHQASVGDELLGESFDTSVWGLRAALSRRRVVLSAAVTSTADDADIQSPYGSYPGYASMMIADFNRAGELAWLVGAAVHVDAVPGLSAFARFGRGTSARDGADRQEIDATVDYRPPEGPLHGFWLRLRYAFLDEEGDADSAHDVRVILSYHLPIL